MGGPLPKQVQQDSRGCWFTLPVAGMQGYQGRSPWLVGSAAAACPFAASAQQLRKVYRIALVHQSNSIIDMGQNSPIRSYRTFFDELRGLGYVEGQNLIVERFSGEGRRDRYAELAFNVVRLNIRLPQSSSQAQGWHTSSL